MTSILPAVAGGKSEKKWRPELVALSYRILAGIAVAVLVAVLSYRVGYSSAEQKAQAERAKELESYVVALNKEIARGQELATKYERLKQERVRLARSRVDLARGLDCGRTPVLLERLHDSAASDEPVPETAGESACTPGQTGTARLAETIVNNYATCNAWRDQLNALIDWHEEREGE